MTRVLVIGGCGHVGAALHAYLAECGHDVDTLDHEERGNRSNPGNIYARYQELKMRDLDAYECVVWVAGRSSVAAAKALPVKAFNDNLSDLVDLARKLHGQRFLWASSASVLSPATNGHNNIYDATKRAGEAILPLIYPASLALRFGTVCGASPNLRPDLMINKMTRDALVDGRITVVNPFARRPILGVADLCHAVERLVAGPVVTGTVNLCSFTLPIAEIADQVANLTGCREIDVATPAPGYDYGMEASRIDGWEPRESVKSIVDGLMALHEATGLETFL